MDSVEDLRSKQGDSSGWPTAPEAWNWDAAQIEQWQLSQLNAQLRTILPSNQFYRDKLACNSLQLESLEQLRELPLTDKTELVQSAAQSEIGLSTHHTFDRSAYSRMHRTSGTTGNPMMVLDTVDDWNWWSTTWQHVLEAGEVSSSDVVFLAFSFGPFIGFWSAHQACVDRKALVIPGGGLSSLARLEFMRDSEATVVCCTPSYALHLAEISKAEGFPLAQLPVRRIIVAGEAGGSVLPTRAAIESAWGAQVVDHSGATEIGPWGFGWPDAPGLHIIETSFIAELLPIESVDDPQLRELVITSIGRHGAPVLRYRTGDAVRAVRKPGKCNFLWLPDGVVGRVDNMVTVRGVNVFPSSIDAIIREFDSVVEYRVLVTREGHLDQLAIEVESSETVRESLAKIFSVRLGLRIPVVCVEPESLPRSEGKSRRWNDLRNQNS